jgi:hypothetical protein
MPRRDDRRRGDEEEKPVKPAGRPVWVYYLGGTALFLLLLVITAITGAWLGAESIPPPHPFEEEEAELRRLEEAQEQRLRAVRGLDLARERPLVRAGDRDRLMHRAPRLLLPGRATDGVSLEPVSPEVKGELARPLHLRRSDASTMERDIRDVSAPLTEAGNLGRSEQVRTPANPPRVGISVETGVPEIQTPDMRAIEDQPIDVAADSTAVTPPRYTTSQDPVQPRPIFLAR